MSTTSDRSESTVTAPILKPGQTQREHPIGWRAASWVGVAVVIAISACSSDDAGHTKTTQKKVIDTPTEHTTVTETHEKTTTYDPK